MGNFRREHQEMEADKINPPTGHTCGLLAIKFGTELVSKPRKMEAVPQWGRLVMAGWEWRVSAD